MFGVTDITTYVVGVVFIVLLPGPNSMFVLSVAGRAGVRAGYRAAAGVFVGDLVLMCAAAAGMASLLQAYPALFGMFKIAGAMYLAWLGLGMLRRAWRDWRSNAQPRIEREPAAAPVSRPFARALTISLMNPKAILFFVSFFLQFVDPGYAHPALSFAILGAIVQVVSLGYLSALIFAGHRLASGLRTRRRVAAGANGGVGALFLTFSARLATAAAG
ncbi:MAG: leucine efflux protein LeuE [Nevskiales bacterium]|nr:leucine efflux protein LeuE [Nevskiales bacterium]